MVAKFFGYGGNDDKDKPIFKHQIVNEMNTNVFKHLRSTHYAGIQSSRYVMIENDMERL